MTKETPPVDWKMIQESIVIDTTRLIKEKSAQYQIAGVHIQDIRNEDTPKTTIHQRKRATRARDEIIYTLVALDYPRDLVARVFGRSKGTIDTVLRREALRKSRPLN